MAAVNDAPVLTVPGAQTVNEDTLLSITGISVADVDAATGAVKITMSVAQGRLTLAQTTGLTFTVGDGTSDAAMTFTGTVANVNLALARVDYLGNANFSGADTLSISVDDQGEYGLGRSQDQQQDGWHHCGGSQRLAGADGTWGANGHRGCAEVDHRDQRGGRGCGHRRGEDHAVGRSGTHHAGPGHRPDVHDR